MAPTKAPRRGVEIREVVFGGVTLRIEHDGTDVVLVLPDGAHLLGTWQEASQLAGELLLDRPIIRRG